MLHQECLQGHGAAVVVSGPVASGKTELLRTLERRVRDSNCLVLDATGSRTERSLPFAVMAQIFQPVADVPEYTDQVAKIIDLNRCANVSVDAPVEEIERYYAPVFQSLWVLLNSLASGRPVVIFVDDVHHADELSTRGLLFLARRLRFSRVLLVMTEESDPYRQNKLFHTDLLRQRHCHRLRLAPLSRLGVTELLTDLLGARAARELGPVCHTQAGGNPLLVEAIAEDHLALDAPEDGELVGGEAYREAVLACLHRGAPLLRSVACGIAVLGERTEPDLLARVLDCQEEVVRKAGETLETMGLTVGLRFRMAAARDAVYDHVPADQRHRMRLRAATLLHDDAAPASEITRWLLAAGRVLPAWSVSVLRAAAEEAARHDHVEQAISCLDLAYRTSTDPAERGAIVAESTILQWRAGSPEVGRGVTDLMAMSQEGALTRDDTGVLLRHLLWKGDFDAAEEVLERYEILPSTARPAADRFLRASIRYSYPRLAPGFPARTEPVEPGGGLDPLHQAAEIIMAALEGRVDAGVVGDAERFLEGCRLQDTTLEPLCDVLTVLLHSDRAGTAARWCDFHLDQASAYRAPIWQAMLGETRARIALWQGDLASARQHAATALELLEPERWGVRVGGPLSVLVRVATDLGDLDEAGRLLSRPVPRTMFLSRFGLQYLYARGRYYLATDRAHSARDDFELCGELAARWGVDLPGLTMWRLGLAESHLRLGDPGTARRLAEDELDRAPSTRSRVRGLSLRLLAAARVPADRVKLLSEAVRVFRACSDRHNLAESLAALGELTELLDSDDAEPDRCAPARPEGRDATEPGDPLSQAEWRVADLAARGRSNREIAAELFITVSTVEQHLTRTYRKLNVSSRAALMSLLAPSDSTLTVS
ncbi:hypothetical protein GCM10010439_63820 [Actinocorallia aurantiaca]|uniref:HTH luxR-type domain-containing protein n=2 Tax=Actinocorallia aurantiaca TaxID=46204 RepID=A0ABN3UPB1_9ACTN